MMSHRYGLRREAGAALIISLLLLAVLLILGSGALTNSRIDTQIASNDDKAKQALVNAEYSMSLGEQRIEQALRQLDLGLGHSPGHYIRQPPWRALTWDDRDSVDVRAFFVEPGAPNPNNLPLRPASMQDAHELPRLIIEEKFFKRHSLTIGQGPPKGISYLNITAHAGRAQWTPAERPALPYDERYPSTRIVIQSTYAKRYD